MWQRITLDLRLMTVALCFLTMAVCNLGAEETGSVTYEDGNGIQRYYNFIGDGTGKLSLIYYKGAGWQHRDQGPGQNAYVYGKPGVISYPDGTEWMYAFVRSSNGRLWLNRWDGANWTWHDQGAFDNPATTSSDTTVLGSPGVVTFKDGSGPQEIHAFVRSQIIGTSVVHLFRHHRDSSGWHWEQQGAPSGVSSLEGTPAVVSFKQGSSPREIWAAVRGNGKLFVNHFDGTSFSWMDRGQPAGVSLTGSAALITYAYGSVPQEVQAFVRGSDGNLYSSQLDNSTVSWQNRGVPAGTSVSGSPGAITVQAPGQSRETFVFVRGTDGRLYRLTRNGFFWTWQDQGTPTGTTVLTGSTPELVSALYGQSDQRIYAFVEGADGKLYTRYRKNGTWRWSGSLGTP